MGVRFPLLPPNLHHQFEYGMIVFMSSVCSRSECGKPFLVKKGSTGMYCSRSCAAIVNNSKHPKRSVEGSCDLCGKSISKTRKYCSLCFNENKADILTKNRATRVEKTAKGKPRLCPGCSLILKDRHRIYCTRECGVLYKRKTQVQKWLNGEWDGSEAAGLSRIIRDYLISEAGNKCTVLTCAVPGGFREVNPRTGRVPLEIDHIDGDCFNNKIENLVVLCPNCHSLTDTYRGLNIGKSTRKYRNKQITSPPPVP